MNRTWREIRRERMGMDFFGLRISDSPGSIDISFGRNFDVCGEFEMRVMTLGIARENLPALAFTLAARLAIDGFPDFAFDGSGDRLLVSARPIDETREFTITNRGREPRGELRLTEGMTEGLMQRLVDKAWGDYGNAHCATAVAIEEPVAESYILDRSDPDFIYIQHTRTNRSGSRWEGRLVMRRSNIPWLVAQLLVVCATLGRRDPNARCRADGDALEVYQYAGLACVMNSRPWKDPHNPRRVLPYDGRYLLMMTRDTAEKLHDELVMLL